jgi:hypothetical protein
MATTVYEVKELILDDGSTVTCKPANIKVLRKGQELIEHLGELTDEDDNIESLLDIVCLCLKRQRPDFEKTVEIDNEDGSKSTKTVPDYEVMEELFDLETVFEVIYRFLGIKLNDPKLLEAAAKMAMLQAEEKEQAGTS